ncbi:hypothetical protein ACFX13_015242 [Malus domestica]
MTVDDQQSSVRVTYDSLTRGSEHKLEEVLRQWSSQDPIEAVESDHNEPDVPLYDRGYAIGLTLAGNGSSNLEGGLEIIDDASRCFNCGSYNHSLKKCPKPRNNAAVNSARKQLKSKRNQNAGSCNPTRYYQKSSAAGKYDGLRPGVLDAETQKLLETILIRLEIY